MERIERADSPTPSPRRLRFEQLRADYEVFLQTFEKPTQIYRFLRSRHVLSPIFLHRSLSYLKSRRSKKDVSSKTRRQKFKIEDMLERKKKEVEDLLKKDENLGEQDQDFLNVTFDGFFHGPEFGEEIFNTTDLTKQASMKEEFVDVSLQLIKVWSKRRKGDDYPVDTLELGKCTSLWNPKTKLLSSVSTSSIVIPRKAFTCGGKAIKTHLLSIQVTVPVSKKGSRRISRYKPGGEAASGGKDAEESTNGISEPPSKKFKRQSSVDAGDDGVLTEFTNRVYTAELIVFDKHKNCLLTNGEYELLLRNYMIEDGGSDDTPKKGRGAENGKNKASPFEMFAFGPTIKFKLNWKDKPVIPFETRSASLIQKLSKQTKGKKTPQVQEQSPKEPTRIQPALRVFYQFIYNNNTRQQTEAREDFYCPWCSINCVQLYSLLKHLKTCHSRFIFIYTSLTKGARVDVCINENYEFSCRGSNKIMPLQGKDFPSKRQQMTEVIIARPYKDNEDLQEFTEPDCSDIDGVKPFFKGHDRVYYHSNACVPMKPQEIDYNSEDHATPDWLKTQTEFMIDEFTDVNEGEKELMKIWNMHIMNGCYISDFQLPLACKSFVEQHWQEIVDMKLTRNLLLHLVNLCEFNLISQPTVLSTMTVFKSLVTERFKDQ